MLHPLAATALAFFLLAAPAVAPAQPADTVLINGKIVTVDDRFTLAQALAIRAGRIVKVGTTDEIDALKGSSTRIIDLNGRAVIPGLIDNHSHWIRAAEHNELRFDGVTSRRRALEMLAERAAAARPGEWIVVLGGWSEEQFTDEARGFPLHELDGIAANNPVVLQAVYNHSYLNSAALAAANINSSTPDPQGGKIEKDASGKPTGMVRGPGGVAFVAAATPDQVDRVLAEIPQQKPFQGDDYFDHIGWGESIYGPVTTNTMRAGANTRPADMAQFRRITQALAEYGLHANVHVEMEPAIDAFLDQYEEINKVHPIKGLRWAFSHLDQVTEKQLERMKRLGMSAQIHSRPLIQGVLMHKVHGERAWDMPPFRRVQDSGVHWGLGSDATAVTTSNPFYTLSLAITGRMVGGHHVNRQSITREEALIAHTRSNAFFLFQEGNLGSLAPGKYADLLVLDRDYLTVPADEIKDIEPLITMVGGKVVYEAAPR